MKPMEDVEAFIDGVLREIEHAGARESVGERLRHGLIEDDRPEVPRFPTRRPNVMFERGDPLPQRLGWGARVWATEADYDENLAQFLGGLTCGADATVHIARGLAWRALVEREWVDRLYAKHLAERLTGDDCPPAAGLPDDLRAELRQIAVR